MSLLVTFSDTHCGSTMGLMPEELELFEDGNVITPNASQKWLLQAWEEVWAKVNYIINGDPYTLAFIGDAIEGLHHKKRQVISDNKLDHIAAFDAVVGPKLMEAENRIFVLGTEAHGGATDELKLAEKYDCLPHPDTGRRGENRWLVNLNRYPIVLRHHINVTTREYLRTNALSINLGNEQLAAVKRGYTVPLGMVAGHRHIHDCIDDGRSFCVVCGPWQLTTRYGHTHWSPMLPEPSISILDARETEPGEKPLIYNFKVTPPEPNVLEI